MDEDQPTKSANAPGIVPPTGAAARALAEAEARRAALKRIETEAKPREINGRQGPEPVRYGDWENKGIASDF
jgi:hypothetical protein